MTSGQQDSESNQQAQGRAGKIMTLIRSYMSSGHFKADLDPLNLKKAYAEFGAQVRT